MDKQIVKTQTNKECLQMVFNDILFVLFAANSNTEYARIMEI